jgi:hypothetical protein
MSIWDDPELRAGGDFFNFNEAGDTISGTIQAIRVQRWPDGKVDPQLLLTTDAGEEKTVTAGQVRLKAALAEQRPEAGDHITLTLTQIEKRTGGKTLKHFDVQINRAGAATTTAQPAAGVPAQSNGGGNGAVDPALAAAVANLTPDQLAALKSL